MLDFSYLDLFQVSFQLCVRILAIDHIQFAVVVSGVGGIYTASRCHHYLQAAVRCCPRWYFAHRCRMIVTSDGAGRSRRRRCGTNNTTSVSGSGLSICNIRVYHIVIFVRIALR